MKFFKLIKMFFCNHKEYYEGWFVQQVRYRECAKCGKFACQPDKMYDKIGQGKNITK
jgi:Zn ribbon nucleic-acid-binding protein